MMNTLRTKSYHDANFVATGRTRGFHYDNFCTINDNKINFIKILSLQHIHWNHGVEISLVRNMTNIIKSWSGATSLKVSTAIMNDVIGW